MLATTMPAVLFRLICVRHGETMANKEGRIQGHIDIPLNDLGKEQARRAGIALASWKFSRAYSSDLSRALQTAQNVLSNNKAASTPEIKPDKRIRERGFGILDHMLISEALSQMAEKNASWPHYTPEGGETMGDVDERFFAFFKTMCQSIYDKHFNTSSCPPTVAEKEEGNPLSLEDINAENIAETVLLVSHGAALKQFYSLLESSNACQFPVEIKDFPRNTAFTIFTVKYSPKKYALFCHDYNNASHIDGIED